MGYCPLSIRQGAGQGAQAEACDAGARHSAGHAQGRDTRQLRHAAWACCWAVGCALGALNLFLTRFDSVLFLSQFLDIVREPGS